MSAKKPSSWETLERIADHAVDEILQTPASEIQQQLDSGELQPRFGRAAYAKALELVGKKRMADAKAELSGRQTGSYPILSLPREKKMELLKKLTGNAANNVTMAARNATEMGDAEVDSALESFIALGILDPDSE